MGGTHYPFAMHLPDIAEPTTPLNYTGDSRKLLNIYLRSLFFGILTLGMYWLRGRLEARRYVWQNIMVGQQSLRWEGTFANQGGAKNGKLIAVLVLLGNTVGWQCAGRIEGAPVWLGWLGNCAFVISTCIMPYAQSMSLNYQLSQTSWKGARFGHDGTAHGYARIYLLGAFANVATLFLAYGSYSVKTRAYLINNSRWGGIKANYSGTAQDVHSMYILGALASVLTLGAYLPWHIARVRNYHASHTSVGPLRLRSTQEGSSLSNLWFSNLLIYLFTLGLGHAVARSRSMRYQMKHLQLLGPVDSIAATTVDGACEDGIVDLFGAAGDTMFGA